MGAFDQAARFAAQASPDAVIRRVLMPTGLTLPFREWLDTRTIPLPGGPKRTADLVAQRYSERTRAWLARAGAALGLLPWAVFVLVVSRTSVITSLRVHEAFQDSGNPGYFLIKIALWIMAFAVIGQALVDIFRPAKADAR